MNDIQTLTSQLQQRFTESISACKVDHGEVTIEVPAGTLLEVCTALRDEADFAFEVLIDLCGVDYCAYGKAEWTTEASTNTGFSRGVTNIYSQIDVSESEGTNRFAVVYHLLSIANNQRLRIRVYPVSDDFPVVDSVVDIWSSANWYEREAFDLYGIMFEGHPDLRRILSDYGFIGHPFRKDYPLIGHLEVRYDEEQKRVVYEPVSIEPRVLVPKVIRDDHRYETGETGEGSTDA